MVENWRHDPEERSGELVSTLETKLRYQFARPKNSVSFRYIRCCSWYHNHMLFVAVKNVEPYPDLNLFKVDPVRKWPHWLKSKSFQNQSRPEGSSSNPLS